MQRFLQTQQPVPNHNNKKKKQHSQKSKTTIGCRATGCNKKHKSHYCRLCKQKNSTHTSANCLSCITLYHQTSPTNAQTIRKSNKLLRGNKGYAGPGIYFAKSIADTQRKARSHGCMITARVFIGRFKVISKPDNTITYSKLKAEGYDSVKITSLHGDEYVVYNHAQVKIKSIRKM